MSERYVLILQTGDQIEPHRYLFAADQFRLAGHGVRGLTMEGWPGRSTDNLIDDILKVIGRKIGKEQFFAEYEAVVPIAWEKSLGLFEVKEESPEDYAWRYVSKVIEEKAHIQYGENFSLSQIATVVGENHRMVDWLRKFVGQTTVKIG